LEKPLNRPYFLGVSRFIPKKNLSVLIGAYIDYRNTTSTEPWDLVLCGDGGLLQEMKDYVSHHTLSESIHFPGFLKPNELLPFFAHAKCFVHASFEEQWGLVVNEAMAAGLPVVVSTRCGCFKDLVVEGENGFGFDPLNRRELVQLFERVRQNEATLETMGNASLTRISNFDSSLFGTGLVKAIHLGRNI
jgi:glycosyltransferase involved in cell wall biosynthesis